MTLSYFWSKKLPLAAVWSRAPGGPSDGRNNNYVRAKKVLTLNTG